MVKAVPLRITTAHSIALTSHPDPESKQLILGYEYDIKIAIFNRDGREVYPSEVISSPADLGSHNLMIRFSEHFVQIDFPEHEVRGRVGR